MRFFLTSQSVFWGMCWFLLHSAWAQPPPATDQDKIAAIEIEQASRSPKWWPLPIAGRVPIVEPLSDQIARKVGKFPFKEKEPLDQSFLTRVPSLNPHRIYSLQECVDIAFRNHEGLTTARKQIELALAKLNEAKRSLFPNATFRSSLTQGETKTAPFKEQEFVLRIEQPLFDGGGIRATSAQAQANLELARANYDKLIQDVRFEVEKNYYELAKTLLQLDIQGESLNNAQPGLELAKKQFEVEVITQLEYLNVQSLYYQIQYQYHSTEKDVTLAQMNLQHAMNVALEPAIRIDDELTFLELKRSLQECQGLARIRRPEILVNSLLVKFHDYAWKVNQAKKQWKVDLASSYGSSGGAFKGETLSLGDDFFVGLQVSRPIGLHSLTSSLTTQKTSPKLGQSDRTESTVASSEFGFFNQFGPMAEEKELEVSYQQAVVELDKIRKTIETEVSESYFNAQKATVLYQSQKTRVEFRKRGLAVVQLQQKINEALISNVLEAQLQLAQEQMALVTALADYHLSLASLNRTTGYAL